MRTVRPSFRHRTTGGPPRSHPPDTGATAPTSTGDAGRIRLQGRARLWAPADLAEVTFTFTVARRAKTSGEAVVELVIAIAG